MTSLHAHYPRLHEQAGSAAGRPAAPAQPSARLSLFINGTAYHIHRMAADPGIASKAFRLRKFDGTEYDVAETVHGPVCDCPDFTFKREGIDPHGCKHVQALVACGLIDQAVGEVASGPLPTDEGPLPRPPHRAADVVPVNGQPTTFLEIVEHEAMGYRAWGTATGRFLADQLARLAQLIRWTGAQTPEDHEDRMEVYERELRERFYEQGYRDGARSHLDPTDPPHR